MLKHLLALSAITLSHATLAEENCSYIAETDSKLCLTIEDSYFNCEMADNGLSFNHCYTNIDYSLTTDYTGEMSISPLVTCRAETTLIDFEENTREFIHKSQHTVTLKNTSKESFKAQVITDPRYFDILYGELDILSCDTSRINIF